MPQTVRVDLAKQIFILKTAQAAMIFELRVFFYVFVIKHQCLEPYKHVFRLDGKKTDLITAQFKIEEAFSRS